MGLKNRNTTTYLNINKGKITRRVTEGTEGAVKRTLESGKVIHELLYDSFEGTLTGIKAREVEFSDKKKSKVWELLLDDNGEKYMLSFPYSSGVASGFLRVIESADLTKPMEFQPSWYNEKNYLFVKQMVGGKMENLKLNYSKDNPNGLPAMKKLTVKGQDVWDDSDQLAFFQNIVDTKIVPKLPNGSSFLTAEEQEKQATDNANPIKKKGPQKKAEVPVAEELPPVSDDLPF